MNAWQRSVGQPNAAAIDLLISAGRNSAELAEGRLDSHGEAVRQVNVGECGLLVLAALNRFRNDGVVFLALSLIHI